MIFQQLTSSLDISLNGLCWLIHLPKTSCSKMVLFGCALYSLPESAKHWNSHFTSGRYERCDSEPCLFKTGDINDKYLSIVIIYVDVCLHTYKGTKMRSVHNGALEKAKLPTPTAQHLTAKLPISCLGFRSLDIVTTWYINDLLIKYPMY